RVQRGFANTVVLCQAADPDTSHTCLAETYRQIRSAECGITILVRLVSFADDLCLGWQLQIRMEVGSRGALNTMRWPGTAAFPETHMLRRVPVSRCKDGNASSQGQFDPVIEDRNHLVTLFHSQSSPGTEIILHVNN